MNNGQCTKEFPKAFQTYTIPNVLGYLLYRRGKGEQVHVRNVIMDNRRVVPYNPYLSLKYNAHINVEVATSVRAIKYIYKYYLDCANIELTSEGQPELRYNEITNFVNCRYVSAPEAVWRLQESPMHHRSHTAGLPVPLYN